MSAQVRLLGAALTLCLLSACQSSPPTHYFLLSPILGAAAPVAAAPGVPIRLARITLPSELDRLELVRRGSGERVQIAVFERWAAPLDDMIRRVIGADLASRLPPGSMAAANEPAGGEARRELYIGIEEFLADAQGTVTLRASWFLQGANAPSARGAEELSVAGDAAADAVPAAMSRALAILSERIAAAIGSQGARAKSE